MIRNTRERGRERKTRGIENHFCTAHVLIVLVVASRTPTLAVYYNFYISFLYRKLDLAH